jgi:G:T-mismatch repair DNA endonuclease (very short patch repair protein)
MSVKSKDYYNPILASDEDVIDMMNRVRQRFLQEEGLFNHVDTFRLIRLMVPDADDNVLKNAQKKMKSLKEGNMLDILYKLIPEMFVAGCIWEKYGAESRECINSSSNLKLPKVRRYLEKYHNNIKKLEDQLDGSGMMSVDEYNSDIKAIKREHKEKLDELERDLKRAKMSLEIEKGRHKTQMMHQTHLVKVLEHDLSMPSQEEQKTSPNKAPDMIPSEGSSS